MPERMTIGLDPKTNIYMAIPGTVKVVESIIVASYLKSNIEREHAIGLKFHLLQAMEVIKTLIYSFDVDDSEEVVARYRMISRFLATIEEEEKKRGGE